jgi:hypothetical protein
MFNKKSNKSIQKKTFSALAISLLTLGLGFTSILNVQTNAQNIGVKPYNEAGQDRGVFRYGVKPGDKINDIALVVNGSDFDGKASILAKDSIVDTSGSIAFLGNNEQNKSVGNWIKISEEKVDVPAQKGRKVPFTINIPGDTKSGEYSAGIIVTPVSSDSTKSGVAVSSRSAITVYITVQGDLKVDNKISDFSAINPKQDNFAVEVDKRGFITQENMVIKFKGENLGNIYTKLNAKLSVELPGGEKKDVPFKRNFNLGNTDNYYYINTSLPYKIGTTKVKMDYTSDPYNFKDEFKFDKSTSSDGSSEYSFTLTQEDLNSFNSIQSQLADKIKKDYAVNSNSDTKKDEFVVKPAEEPKKVETKKEDNNDNKIVIFMGSIIIVLLLILLGYLALNRKKDKKEEEVKPVEKKVADTKEKKIEVKKEKKTDSDMIQDDYKPASTKSTVKKVIKKKSKK